MRDRSEDIWHRHHQTLFLGDAPAGGWPEQFGIITACKPQGRSGAPPSDDALADQQLQGRLQQAGINHWRVAICSPSLLHQKPSWGVCVPFEEVVRLGQEYEQLAVWWVDRSNLFGVWIRPESKEPVGNWREHTTSKKLEQIISLLATNALWGFRDRRNEKELRLWTRVLSLSPDDRLGLGVCRANDSMDRDCTESTLRELVQYVQTARRYPFSGDKGAGSALLMATRYDNRLRFYKGVSELMETAFDVYCECLRVVFRPDLKERVDACDIDKAALQYLIQDHGLAEAQVEEYLHLLKEYPSASFDRKWEIFRHFLANGWGLPY